MHITPSAQHRLQILALQTPDTPYVRLAVDAGGCAGLQYVFSQVSCKDLEDHAIGQDARLVIDPVSWPFLSESVLDFETKPGQAGFVVQNPQAQSACGCGLSFAPKW